MKIIILAVNKMRAGPELELINRYQKRFNQIGSHHNLGPLEIIEIEPDSKHKKKSYQCLNDTVCLLDGRGKTLSSNGLANTLVEWRDFGLKSMTFAIGGSLGKKQLPEFNTHFTLSFGPMVFPHFLARVMLVEQLYRALSILHKSPYHKE